MNNNTSNKLIYLMGAGRSGTTALATFLGSAPEITALGEMHPFLDYISNEIPCSCGAQFKDCTSWKPIVDNLPEDILKNIDKNIAVVKKVESHRSILNHVMKGRNFDGAEDYIPLMNSTLEQCHKKTAGSAIVDSAKYISRALALRHVENQDLKIIYMVRDVRGVVYSFAKNVQTTRGNLSAIVYYMAINLAAEFVCLTVLRNKVLKIKYEDMMEKPEAFFQKVEKFLEIDLSEVRLKIKNHEKFTIGHLVGGNRLRDAKKIHFQPETKWAGHFGIIKQILLYLGAFPLMLLNQYPLFVKGKRK